MQMLKRAAMAREKPLIIVGGGLAGSLAALAIAKRRPDLNVMLLEAGNAFGGNHTWSYFDSDVPAEALPLLAALEPVRWPSHSVMFPQYARKLDMPYNSITSQSLDQLVHQQLVPDSRRTACAVTRIEPSGVHLATGEFLAATGVLDARGVEVGLPGLEVGWQKFVGLELVTARHDGFRPILMDATVEQIDGYRFVYVLPLAPDRFLIEDTYYSNGSDLDVCMVADRVREYASGAGMDGDEIRVEKGVLPIVIGGDPEIFWPSSDPIGRLGLRGGFFHPVTGYSLGEAFSIAFALTKLPGTYDTPTLAAWTRARFQSHWRSGAYFRVLNKMMFHAARPEERHRVFSHFYKMSPGIISRFYAGTLRWTDMVRVLLGRPPVSVGAAIFAIMGKRGRKNHDG